MDSHRLSIKGNELTHFINNSQGVIFVCICVCMWVGGGVWVCVGVGECVYVGVVDIISSGSEEYDVVIVPISSWHHVSFDCEDEIPSTELCGKSLPPFEKVVSDYSRSKWPVMDGISQQGKCLAPSTTYKDLLAAFKIDTDKKDTSHWQSDVVARLVDTLNISDPLMADDFSSRSVRKGDLELVIQSQVKDVQKLFKDQSSEPEKLKAQAVISVSHFLPFPFLNPEKRFLFYPPLAKVIGSQVSPPSTLRSPFLTLIDTHTQVYSHTGLLTHLKIFTQTSSLLWQYLGERLIRLSPDAHIFGHTHFGWNNTLESMITAQDSQVSDNILQSNLLKCRFVQVSSFSPCLNSSS